MTQHDCVSLRERRAISKAWAIVPYSDETYGEGLPMHRGSAPCVAGHPGGGCMTFPVDSPGEGWSPAMLECSHRKESISKQRRVVFQEPLSKTDVPRVRGSVGSEDGHRHLACSADARVHLFVHGQVPAEIVQGMNAIFGCWAHLYPGFRWAYTIDPEPDEVLVRGFCYASEPIGVAGGWGVATCVEFQ